MPKQCSSTDCTNNVFGGGYCLRHQGERKKKEAEQKGEIFKPFKSSVGIAKSGFKNNGIKKPIKKESEKRRKINREEYEPKAREFRNRERICKVCPIIKAGGFKTYCSGRAEAVHHVRGKQTIKDLLNVAWWVASCFWGNGWIEDNSEEAAALGLKSVNYSSKLSVFKK